MLNPPLQILLNLFFDFRPLANSVAQIIQFRPADFTVSYDGYVIDIRRMQWERFFGSDAV